MLRTIAAAEIRQQYRQGVLTVLGVLLIVLLGATLAARLASFQADQAESRAGARRVREQWVSQGSKHPHSGAHFGTAVFRQRLPLEVLEQGIVSFSGSIFPLVTHARDFPIDLPIESTTALTRYGELSPGVIGLAVLSLMIVFAGYGTVAADRDR